MWVLLIMSTNWDGDYKVTEYKVFNTQLSCHIEQAVVETDFKRNEVSTCFYDPSR